MGGDVPRLRLAKMASALLLEIRDCSSMKDIVAGRPAPHEVLGCISADFGAQTPPHDEGARTRKYRLEAM